VKAANAVLREGGPEEQAIFACIKAAGKSRRDQLNVGAIITLEEMAAAAGKSTVRAIRPPSTKTLELQYYKDLRPITQTLARLSAELLIPAVTSILRTEQLRSDQAGDVVDDAMSVMRIQFNREWTEQDYARIADSQFFRVNGQSTRYFNRLSLQVANVPYNMSEPWLDELRSLFVRENVRLIKTIPDQYFDRIDGIITRGIRQGKHVGEVGKELQKAVGISRNRAKFIARDQTAKLNAEMQGIRQVSVGIKKYEWSTSEDERVRPSHASKNNRKYKWSDPPATGHPGEDYQCRCVAIPVVEPPKRSALQTAAALAGAAVLAEELFS